MIDRRFNIVIITLILFLMPGFAKADYFLTGSFFSSETNISKLPLEVSSIVFGNNDRLYLLDKRGKDTDIFLRRGPRKRNPF